MKAGSQQEDHVPCISAKRQAEPVSDTWEFCNTMQEGEQGQPDKKNRFILPVVARVEAVFPKKGDTDD